MIFVNIFAQNINCGYTLEPPSTHNLRFGSKISKKSLPLHTQFYYMYIKVGFMGVYYSWISFPDAPYSYRHISLKLSEDVSQTNDVICKSRSYS